MPRFGAEELQLITGVLARAPAREKGSWRTILSNRGVWTLCVMYFCYNYCLAVYLDWFPTYLNSHRGFNLLRMGFYSSLPLLAGTLGT